MALPASMLADLTINPPTFPNSTTARLTLSGTETNTYIYSIFYTPQLLDTNTPWFIGATGAVGQTSFDLALSTNDSTFYRAVGMAVPATETVATPSFTPGAGAYSSPQAITVTCSTLGASIYYTTNGATPTTSDTLIFSGGSFLLNRTTTLKAKAFKPGATDSGVAVAVYNINGAPIVTAGPQQNLSTTSTTLEGYAIDDGLPSGSTLSNRWSKVSGPGSVSFVNVNLTNTTASFGLDGIYVLQLVGDDSQYKTTNRVTIAVNTTLSVSLVAPGEASTYTVPTNIVLQAIASSSSGTVTSVVFYAGSTRIGTVTSEPFNLDWKTVTEGSYALTAVAYTSDPDNTGLASLPVNIAVSWPTNVGQFTTSFQDLQIPVAGFPISINRLYDTRFSGEGGFGYNWKLDFEQIRIEKSAALSSGYTALISLGQDYIIPNHNTLVTVWLNDSESYSFYPRIVFQSGGTNHIGHTGATYLLPVRWVFDAVGGLGTLAAVDSPNDVGMVGEEYYNESNWQGDIYAGYPDTDGEPLDTYEPDWSSFVFTAPDGIQYAFDSSGHIARKTDRNGNYLDYSSSGITHSTGKAVTFTRDGNNRITEIYDPIAIETTGVAALTYLYDNNGNLTNVSRLVDRATPTYESTGFSYTNGNYVHNITKITDPRGVPILRIVFDASGRMTHQLDALGNATVYTFDLAGHRQIVTDKLNHAVTQNFTDFGLLSSIVDSEGGITSITYDERGRKIGETNALGQGSSFSYDSNDQLIATTNEVGAISTASYNAFGQVLISLDPLGNGTTNRYDANGNLIAVTNALSVISLYSYDAQGNRVKETNGFGTAFQTVTTNQYDSFGNLTNIINALGNSTSYTYDSNGNKLTEKRTRNLVAGTQTLISTNVFDAANRITETRDPDGYTNTIVFNNIAKQSATIDKLGRTNFFYYDARGLLTNTTYADGLFEFTQYDAEGRKTNSLDKASHPTQFTYDNVGRLLRTTYADGVSLLNTYDAAGRLKSAAIVPTGSGMVPPVSPGPIVTTYGYDAAGRRIATTNGFGTAALKITKFSYDANGNQTNVVDGLTRTNKFTYDKLNRQVQVTYPDNTTETTGYDALNQRIAVTNQASVISRFGYDKAGRLVAVTNAFGATAQMITQYKYDQVGNMTNQIDALNRTNKFEYDSMGRRTKEIMPGAQAQTFGYDRVGNLILHTNFNTVVISSQYDSLNRLTNKSAAGGYLVTYAYSSTGQRTNMVDASGTNIYTYDTRDRLLTKDTPQGKLSYAYNALGNLATIQSTNANATSIAYSYDSLNRLTNVTDRFTNNTSYTFDGVGNLQTALYPNAVTNIYSYDSLNRLTNLTSKVGATTLASFAYKLEASGARTNLTESLNSVNRTNTWKYDSLYRLTNEVIGASSGPTGSITNKYDAVGNRTNRASSVTGVTNQTFTFNTNDFLSSDVYDSNGNTRTNGSNVYQYDAENHLTNYNGGAATFVYDGDGNRVRKTVSGTTTYYLLDNKNPSGYAQVLEEFTAFGSTPTLYTYGFDLVSQRQAGGTTSFYGYDGNGNVRFLTGTNAAISDTYVYDAFGILLTSTGTTPNNYKYSGEQYDPNMGFYYLRARYMNPNTGRFSTRDSHQGNIFDPPSLHRYTYCRDNPINAVDPSGNSDLLIGALAVLILVAVISVSVVSVRFGGKITKQKATQAEFQILINILNRGINQMQKNLDSNANTTEELFRNLAAVGQRGLITGTVTDRGMQYSEGVQRLIYYLENSSEFNSLPGAGNRESPLLETQSPERAKIGLEIEITRSRKAIEVLTNEMNRREGR